MSTNQFIGAKQQVELIEQITWGFVAALVVLCIAFAAMVGSGSGLDVVKESVVKQSEVPMSAPSSVPSSPVATPSASSRSSFGANINWTDHLLQTRTDYLFPTKFGIAVD